MARRPLKLHFGKLNFHYFSGEVRLGVLCESSARQFKKIKMVSPTAVITGDENFNT